MLIFGAGYSGGRLSARLVAEGWRVMAIGRETPAETTRMAIADASHILSSVPPEGEVDPILRDWGGVIRSTSTRWIGYLSSTGVYGDTGGAWVDESAPVGEGRRIARAQADQAWQALRPDVRVFRLPGIYGPGRSVLDRIPTGRAHRIDGSGQLFSRIHVDDIVGGIIASFAGPPGIYNLADDQPCAQADVVEFGCRLLGLPVPPLLALDSASLSPQARAFYSENRRVANGRARRWLGWQPLYASYREGLAACLARP